MNAPGRVSIERIKAVVAARFDVPVASLAGARRDFKFVRPRHAAIYLACSLTPHSMSVIGRLFGDRDHSTIYHAHWKTAQRRAADRDFDQRIRAIELELAPTPTLQPEIQLSFLIGPLFDQVRSAPRPTLTMLEAA